MREACAAYVVSVHYYGVAVAPVNRLPTTLPGLQTDGLSNAGTCCVTLVTVTRRLPTRAARTTFFADEFAAISALVVIGALPASMDVSELEARIGTIGSSRCLPKGTGVGAAFPHIACQQLRCAATCHSPVDPFAQQPAEER